MSAVYPLTKQAMLKGDVDLDGTVKIVAVSTGYTYAATHDFLDDVASTSRLGTAATLSNKTFTNGTFHNTAAVSYTGVTSTMTIKAFIGFIATTAEATSRLVWHCNVRSDATPLSYTGNGSAISVSWPLGSVFSL